MNEIYNRIDPETGEVVGRGVRTVINEPSRTKQSFKDECDINTIMKRFERTGLITHNNARAAYFDDVSEVPDFAAAVATVRKADEMFMSLPAKLRAEFDNDPQQYVAFCADPANSDRMVELGLKPKPEVVAPMQVQVMNLPVTPSETP